jgi:hypothetical protein
LYGAVVLVCALLLPTPNFINRQWSLSIPFKLTYLVFYTFSAVIMILLAYHEAVKEEKDKVKLQPNKEPQQRRNIDPKVRRKRARARRRRNKR